MYKILMIIFVTLNLGILVYSSSGCADQWVYCKGRNMNLLGKMCVAACWTIDDGCAPCHYDFTILEMCNARFSKTSSFEITKMKCENKIQHKNRIK